MANTTQIAVTVEMAAAVCERGWAMQAQLPIVRATFDNGANTGTVRLVGTKGPRILVKRDDGTSDVFAVNAEHLSVTTDVAEHLEIAMSYIFRFREMVQRQALRGTGRNVLGQFNDRLHRCEPAGRR